jgi:hypothetical protein
MQLLTPLVVVSPAISASVMADVTPDTFATPPLSISTSVELLSISVVAFGVVDISSATVSLLDVISAAGSKVVSFVTSD